MTKKHGVIVLGVALTIITVTTANKFTLIPKGELSKYEKQQIEYNELKQHSKEFTEMVEGYKKNYNNLEKKYEQTKKDYEKYKEETNIDLNKELEDLKNKKEKYTNLINEYSQKLNNQ